MYVGIFRIKKIYFAKLYELLKRKNIYFYVNEFDFVLYFVVGVIYIGFIYISLFLRFQIYIK